MIRLVTSFFIVLFPLGIAAASDAAKHCPAINCDCDSLPNEHWLQACKQHEARIKQRCVENADTPQDYCSIHGLDAKPLPLSIEFNEYQVDSSVDPGTLVDKVVSLQSAIYAYMNEAKESYSEGNFARSMQILKLIDSNIDSHFEYQQKVEASYVAQIQDKKVKGAWKRYSVDTLKYAMVLEKFGVKLASRIEGAATAKEKKIHTVLAKKSLRMAGKSYEHCGFAFGHWGRNEKAADAWNRASSVSVQLTGINKLTGAKKEAVKFSEFQAAARLHRASYHHLLNDNIKGSTRELKESQMFLNREEHKSIDNLVNAIEKNNQGGVLSGR